MTSENIRIQKLWCCCCCYVLLGMFLMYLFLPFVNIQLKVLVNIPRSKKLLFVLWIKCSVKRDFPRIPWSANFHFLEIRIHWVTLFCTENGTSYGSTFYAPYRHKLIISSSLPEPILRVDIFRSVLRIAYSNKRNVLYLFCRPLKNDENSIISNVRHKIVVMGAAKVGKSSIITQFLYGTFSPKYKRTVEEMHHGHFSVGGVNLTLDILDTSGSYEVSPIHFEIRIK